MTIHGYWWLLIDVAVGVAAATIIHLKADRGGRHCVDFGDPYMGCVVPVVTILLSIIAGLIASHSNLVLRFGASP